jgi:carbon monoxide dehydrogenase subunit G
MRLRHEFLIGAPLDRIWDALVDVPLLAGALPGASIESGAEGGAWRGRLRAYTGTVRIQDVDDDDRVVSFRLEGRETGGPANVAATITARLAAVEDRTRVVVETDLRATGRRLDHSAMEDAVGTVLDGLAGESRGQRLERTALVLGALLAALALVRVVRRR